jgi:cysteine desulfurase/selenocysteine lyase
LQAHREALIRELDEGLRRLSGVRLLGPAEGEPRIPVFSLGLAGTDSVALAEQLKAKNVWVRAGRHNTESLHAMLGLAGSLRFSAQTYNSLDEVRRAIAALEELLLV